MSIQMIDMLDLGETLMMRGLEARTMLLKMWLLLRMLSTSSEEKQELVMLLMYGIPTILR